MLPIRPPVIQLAIDLFTVDEALRLAETGAKAGVDWLEAGTPLIVRRGADAIGAIARAFPEFPVLADYKTMDSGGRNVQLTAEQGGKLMTVCAGATDETIASAVAASRDAGVLVVVDTIGVRDPWARAREVEALGAHSVYLHYGADQRRADATRDSTQWVAEIVKAVKVPVGAGTFGVEDGVRAAALGADVIVIGHPLISGPDPLGALREYCERVRAAYRPVERNYQWPEDNPSDAACSFCGRARRIAGPMVEGPDDLFICASCVTTASSIVRKLGG